MKKDKIKIERLGIFGEGVARLDGLALFVDGALPEETVSVEVYEKRKTFARAKAVQWQETSPFRQTPPCPLFGSCGGCQLMHLTYAQQLVAKRMRVVDALERIGKLSVPVVECIPSPHQLSYRNKIQLPVNINARLGLYAQNSHEIVEISHCQIHCPLGEKTFQQLQKLIQIAHGIKHVLIKTAVNTEQVLVVLVTSGTTLLTGLAKQLMESSPEIKGVVQNIHPSMTNRVLSEEFHLLAGQDWIEESLSGLQVKVSPASFFQVNPPQAEILYQTVLDYAQLRSSDTVLDAYCGVGVLTLLCAQKAKQALGIESVPEAIGDAQENAQKNQINNASFFCAKVEESVDKLKLADVVILNPPRKGCDKTVLDSLIVAGVSRIVYVSCDPATLARDLAILTNGGYQLKRVQPLDMFPQTMHVECVAQLSRVEV